METRFHKPNQARALNKAHFPRPGAVRGASQPNLEPGCRRPSVVPARIRSTNSQGRVNRRGGIQLGQGLTLRPTPLVHEEKLDVVK